MNRICAVAFLPLFFTGCIESVPENIIPGKRDLQAPVAECRDGITYTGHFNVRSACSISDNQTENPGTAFYTSADPDQPGQYPMAVTVRDASGNITIMDMTVTVPTPAPKPAKPEEKTPEEEKEQAEEKKPVSTAAPAPVPEKTADPYAAERQHCRDTWGTWNGTSCSWPTPEPVPAAPEVPSVGSTTCWDYTGADGRTYHSCEWIGDWEEY